MQVLVTVLATCSIATTESRAGSDLGIRAGPASVLLNRLPYELSSRVVYVDAYRIFESANKKALADIPKNATEQGTVYLVDFHTAPNEYARRRMKNYLGKFFGISLSDDWLAVSRYRNSIIYTPISGPDQHEALANVVRRARTGSSAQRRRAIRAASGRPRDTSATPAPNVADLPHRAFYLEVYRPIRPEECTFRRSIHWNRGTRVYCHNAHISLIYRINLMRSLKFATSGSSTPDAKLVRISLDAESAGTGITLNSRLFHDECRVRGTVLDGWIKDFSSSAIARDYRFSVRATGYPATVLKTFPASSLNREYTRRDISGFDIGVIGSGEVDPLGPRARLEAKMTFTQSRMLDYKTQDYRVVRRSEGPAHILFSWERDQYPTAASLLGWHTGPVWKSAPPINRELITPVSYTGFTPNFDVIYMTSPFAAGATEFSLSSSVDISPVYASIYKHYYFFGVHLSAQAQSRWQQSRRVTDERKFTVHWDDVVFTGARPVNLQFGDFNSKCMETGDTGELTTQECDLRSTSQSFIYDKHGRYQSAIATGQCLDALDLSRLATCNADRSQQWDWVDNAHNLKNAFSRQFLGYDRQSGRPTMISAPTPEAGNTILTRYTDVFLGSPVPMAVR